MSQRRRKLRLETLKTEASAFARHLSDAVAHGGTRVWIQGRINIPRVLLEFYTYLGDRYVFTLAPGGEGGDIDFPELGVEIKVLTRGGVEALHPQTNAEQRVYGLDADLLLFILPESWAGGAPAPDTPSEAIRVMFISREYTGDHNVTLEIAHILEDPSIGDPDVRRDELAQYLKKALRIQLRQSRLLAERLQARQPKIGVISLRAQSHWRVGFSSVLSQARSLVGSRGVVRTSRCKTA